MLDKIRKLVETPISLRSIDHKYILDTNLSIDFFNVTNLVEDQFPPFEREKIAGFLVNKTEKYSGYTKEELLQEWKDIKDAGTAVHRQLEKYIENGNSPSLSKAKAGVDWFESEISSFGEKVFPEVIVFSEKLKIAGTVDLLVYNKKKNQCHIFDWKTSKRIDFKGKKKALTSACSGLTDCRFDQYSLQLSMYAYLLETCHNIKVVDCFMVHLMENDVNCIRAENHRNRVKKIFSTTNGLIKNQHNNKDTSNNFENSSENYVKKGLFIEGFTSYYFDICPYSDCNRQFKVKAYYSEDTKLIIGAKHYDCFSCGKTVHYVNPTIGLLTDIQYKENSQQNISSINYPSNTSSNCFVATEVYGNRFHDNVIVLKYFRDKSLATNWVGRHLINFYYYIGPSTASFLSLFPLLKKLVKKILNKIVRIIIHFNS